MIAPRRSRSSISRSTPSARCNLLEAARRSCPESPFYPHVDQQGLWRPAQRDLRSPNSRRAGTTPTRPMSMASPKTFPIDQSKHSLFGASKVGGRCHGAGVRPLLQYAHLLPARRLPHRPESLRRRAARLSELSGASAISKAASTRSSATRASRSATTSIPRMWRASCTSSAKAPRVAEVYNLGGGKGNSCSILEAFSMAEAVTGNNQ